MFVNSTLLNRLAARVRQCRQWLAGLIAGEPVQFANTPSAHVAGCAVFWFSEGTGKKFLLIRHAGKANRHGFVNFFHLTPGQQASSLIREATRQAFGEAFIRTLDNKALEADRVAAVPTFHQKDDATGATIPVQTLVWVKQISAAQAELASTQPNGPDVIILPEFALLGTALSQAHKSVYQSITRHIHGEPLLRDMLVAHIDDLMNDDVPPAPRAPRVLH